MMFHSTFSFFAATSQFQQHQHHHIRHHHHQPMTSSSLTLPIVSSTEAPAKEFVEMECGAESTACQLANGDEGFFVCRSRATLATNAGSQEQQQQQEKSEAISTTICIPSFQGLEGDMCGCCENDCSSFLLPKDVPDLS